MNTRFKVGDDVIIVGKVEWLGDYKLGINLLGELGKPAFKLFLSPEQIESINKYGEQLLLPQMDAPLRVPKTMDIKTVTNPAPVQQPVRPIMNQTLKADDMWAAMEAEFGR